MTRSSWLWAGGSREGEPDEHCRAGRSHRLEPQRGTGRPFGASSKPRLRGRAPMASSRLIRRSSAGDRGFKRTENCDEERRLARRPLLNTEAAHDASSTSRS